MARSAFPAPPHPARGSRAMTSGSRPLERATIALFCTALCLPALDQLVRPSAARDPRTAERRAPAPLPGPPGSLAELASFPRRLEAHDADTFGLRDVLLAANAAERWFVFGRSPSPLVEPAAEGWCFYGNESRDVHRGLRPFRADELEGWVRRLRERRDFLAARGIRYLFVPCPNKETIYPERVPARWKKLGPTRLEQLVERLAREPDAPFLDLRPALLAAKAGDRPEDWLYTRMGTHWNGRGAHAVYAAIVARLQPDFPALVAVPAESCRTLEATGATDSLANQLYLARWINQRQYAPVPPERGYEVQHAPRYEPGDRLITRKDLDAPRLLWLHDSFGPSLQKLLCESFAFVEAHWTPDFPVEVVLETRPDVVLETYVERLLLEDRPDRPIDSAAEPAEALFARATDVAWRADADFADVQPFDEARLERVAGELRVHAPGTRGGVVLPVLPLAPGARALLRVEAECTARTALNVFVRAPGAEAFVRKNHAYAELGPDARAAVLRLPDVGPGFETLLRFDPAGAGLRVRSLEVRFAPLGR